MSSEPLIPHLFRTEYRKIVSVLCRHFGFREIEVAEDIASDTFLVAAQAWGIEGPPPNPAGWLYNTAKNKAKNYLHRHSIYEERVLPEIRSGMDGDATFEIDLTPENITDSQLQMLFAVCHPAISEESQVGLALRVLCGFGIQEIADAFLTTTEVINKRLTRARERLREIDIRIEMPAPAEMDVRLGSVLTTIYLLFNEGYYSMSQDRTLRKDICLEAMRLCAMLIENNATNKPQVNALMAMMCFHASRFDARTDASGERVLYEEQDPGLWNADLIRNGCAFLQSAAKGDEVSRYHLEAGIAYWHTQKEDSPEKWSSIVFYYDQLLKRNYSPVAALNRAFAISKWKGKAEGIHETEVLGLEGNHFYFALLGELYDGIDRQKALENLESALQLARTAAERRAIRKRITRLS
ncbi:MAG: sigma-70 family RNA polymerase sigma factor [Dyadobacter sp.]|uniref:RNA polymerase sigma factor n=1 Tax=Dyadobacter sp. TaxID=1914288 RepID=UPI001B0C0F09|nr:sigma-70 family RNA polymerase sigma factor [Dyadobacter sp.]MBO9615093.1 sigma-70 family RNA polymerase sigma factor [Dyadobacter sp.]